MIPLETLHHDSFSPHVGQPFSVTTGAGPIEVELCAVEKLGHRRPGASRDPFSLRFRGNPELRLPQGMYAFSREGFGELEIFITQIAGGSRESEFEAVFT